MQTAGAVCGPFPLCKNTGGCSCRKLPGKVKQQFLVFFFISDSILLYRTTNLMKTLRYSIQSRPREAPWDLTGRYWLPNMLTSGILAT